MKYNFSLFLACCASIFASHVELAKFTSIIKTKVNKNILFRITLYKLQTICLFEICVTSMFASQIELDMFANGYQ